MCMRGVFTIKFSSFYDSVYVLPSLDLLSFHRPLSFLNFWFTHTHVCVFCGKIIDEYMHTFNCSDLLFSRSVGFSVDESRTHTHKCVSSLSPFLLADSATFRENLTKGVKKRWRDERKPRNWCGEVRKRILKSWSGLYKALDQSSQRLHALHMWAVDESNTDPVPSI